MNGIAVLLTIAAVGMKYGGPMPPGRGGERAALYKPSTADVSTADVSTGDVSTADVSTASAPTPDELPSGLSTSPVAAASPPVPDDRLLAFAGTVPRPYNTQVIGGANRGAIPAEPSTGGARSRYEAPRQPAVSPGAAARYGAPASSGGGASSGVQPAGGHSTYDPASSYQPAAAATSVGGATGGGTVVTSPYSTTSDQTDDRRDTSGEAAYTADGRGGTVFVAGQSSAGQSAGSQSSAGQSTESQGSGSQGSGGQGSASQINGGPRSSILSLDSEPETEAVPETQAVRSTSQPAVRSASPSRSVADSPAGPRSRILAAPGSEPPSNGSAYSFADDSRREGTSSAASGDGSGAAGNWSSDRSSAGSGGGAGPRSTILGGSSSANSSPYSPGAPPPTGQPTQGQPTQGQAGQGTLPRGYGGVEQAPAFDATTNRGSGAYASGNTPGNQYSGNQYSGNQYSGNQYPTAAYPANQPPVNSYPAGGQAPPPGYATYPPAGNGESIQGTFQGPYPSLAPPAQSGGFAGQSGASGSPRGGYGETGQSPISQEGRWPPASSAEGPANRGNYVYIPPRVPVPDGAGGSETRSTGATRIPGYGATSEWPVPPRTADERAAPPAESTSGRDTLGEARPAETAGATPATPSPGTVAAAGPASNAAAGGLPSEEDRPWVPLTLTMFGLLLSLGANAYLAWIALGLHSRYRELVYELRHSQANAA